MALRVAVLDGRLHDRAAFSCGIAALDDYLRTRASSYRRYPMTATDIAVLGCCLALVAIGFTL